MLHCLQHYPIFVIFNEIYYMVRDYLIIPSVVRKINEGKGLFMYLESLMILIKVMLYNYVEIPTYSWPFVLFLAVGFIFNILYVMSLVCARLQGSKLPWSFGANFYFVINTLFLVLVPLSMNE